MARADIPFPLSSAPGRSPGEGAGRLLNCYAEPLGKEATSNAVWRRSAGLKAFCTATDSICRGFLEVNGSVFAVIGRTMFLIAADGSVSTVGTVAGTKKVFMARNNRTPDPDKVLVTENGAFTFTAAAITVYPDADLPQPMSVSFQGGYFVFPIADGRCFASDLNSTAINSLSFGTAETKPDGLVHAVPFNNQMLLLGLYSTEFWPLNRDPPAVGFPFLYSTTVSRGLIATTAIAGHENGFGGAALIAVTDDNTVSRLNGYAWEKISPPDLDHLIELVSDKTTLEALVYVSGGHAKWVLSSNTWTWEFDLNSQKWNERESFGLTRWRGTQSVWAFGKWLIGDNQSGKVLSVDSSVYKEDVNALRFRLESGPVQDFPARTRIARADFDFASGVGIASGSSVTQTDPVVDISWSDDGGSSWSNPIQRQLGQQGKYLSRVTIYNCGLSGVRGRRWRLDVSDPVYVGVTKAVQSDKLRDDVRVAA